jgi:hypothetical protein
MIIERAGVIRRHPSRKLTFFIIENALRIDIIRILNKVFRARDDDHLVLRGCGWWQHIVGLNDAILLFWSLPYINDPVLFFLFSHPNSFDFTKHL